MEANIWKAKKVKEHEFSGGLYFSYKDYEIFDVDEREIIINKVKSDLANSNFPYKFKLTNKVLQWFELLGIDCTQVNILADSFLDPGYLGHNKNLEVSF